MGEWSKWGGGILKQIFRASMLFNGHGFEKRGGQCLPPVTFSLTLVRVKDTP